MEKCAIFIDGGYVDALLKRWNDFPLDYEKLIKKICEILDMELLRVYYYNCLPIVRKMYKTQCYKCHEKCDVHFDPEEGTKIYCEKCIKEGKFKINQIKYDEKITEEDKNRYKRKKNFYNKLKRLPRFEVKYGRLQIIGGEFKQKAVDVKMSLDIADKCFENQIQHAVIIAGDSDFIPAIHRAKEYGAIIHLFCNKEKINRELLDEVDEIHELTHSFVQNLKK